MQKKIISLAIAAAISTPAFADVTAYGVLDGAVANISNTGKQSDIIALSGAMSASRIGFKASEDLGDGLTVLAVMEYKIDGETSQTTNVAGSTSAAGKAAVAGNTTAASTFAARQQMLALTGGFGTVATGYLQTTAWDFAGKYDPTSGSAASPYDTIAKGDGFLIGATAAASRASRAVAYISPTVGGVTVAVNYATALSDGTGNLTVADPGGNSSKTTASLVSATYADGPLSASVVYAGTNTTPATSNASEYALGGSYDLGVAKLSATYQSQTNNAATSTTNSLYSVAAVVPFGGDALAVTYAASTMNAASSNSTGYTLGYIHNMSKTVTAYAAYSAITNDANAALGVANTLVAPTAGGNSSLIGFGLRKKF